MPDMIENEWQALVKAEPSLQQLDRELYRTLRRTFYAGNLNMLSTIIRNMAQGKLTETLVRDLSKEIMDFMEKTKKDED